MFEAHRLTDSASLSPRVPMRVALCVPMQVEFLAEDEQVGIVPNFSTQEPLPLISVRPATLRPCCCLCYYSACMQQYCHMH